MIKQVLSPAEAYLLFARGHAATGLHVKGLLDYSEKSERPLPSHFPEGLTVDALDVSGSRLSIVPPGLTCYELNLAQTPIQTLPDDVRVKTRLNLSGCDELVGLPVGLTVGTLILRGCNSLRSLPEGLDVWFLDLSGCWAFENWPASAQVHSGRLLLRGCTALRSLPFYFSRLAALNVRDCPNLTCLPKNLEITGWLDLAHSGLTSESALNGTHDRTQLRWAGINVDRRIAFHPETIQIDEVLGERNAERRRVILDRYGYGRFLQDAQAEILDTDSDPGGPRELLRVKMKDDEDLVAMSCFCPSTKRQYIIRVPPTTISCGHAAAWIAGFDDPNDYRPILET